MIRRSYGFLLRLHCSREEYARETSLLILFCLRCKCDTDYTELNSALRLTKEFWGSSRLDNIILFVKLETEFPAELIRIMNVLSIVESWETATLVCLLLSLVVWLLFGRLLIENFLYMASSLLLLYIRIDTVCNLLPTKRMYTLNLSTTSHRCKLYRPLKSDLCAEDTAGNFVPTS